KGRALARGADRGLKRAGTIERAGLQAGPLDIFNGVLGVLDDAAKALVRVRHVIAPVKIVVHVDLPVAIQRVDAAIEILERLGDLEWGDEFGNFSQEFAQRG